MDSVGEPDLVEEETTRAPIPEANGARDDEATSRDDQPKLKGPARAGDSAVASATSGEIDGDDFVPVQSESFEQQLKEKNDHIISLQIQIKDLKVQLTAEKNAKESAEERIVRLKNLSKERQEKNKELEEKIGEEKSKANSAKEIINKLEGKIIILQEMYDQEKQNYSVLLSKNEQLKIEQEDLEREIKAIKEKMKTTEQEHMKTIKNLKKEMERLELKRNSLYPIDPQAKRIGVALIISIREVKFGSDENPNIKQRAYADDDETRLTKCFGQLGFEVKLRVNLSKDEILECFRKIEIKEDDSRFICFIGSHGGCDENGEFFCDKNGERVRLEEVYGVTKEWKKLKNNPKIFIIQACRGDEEDEIDESSQISALSDIFVSFCTAPNHKGHRPAKQQKKEHMLSLFVKFLCEALDEDHEADIATIIMENVHQKMQAENIGVVRKILSDGSCKRYRQCPFILSSLRGPVHLIADQGT